MKILVNIVNRALSLLLFLVLLSPIGLFAHVKSVPQFSTQHSLEDLGQTEYRELTTKIIVSLQQFSLSSNIFTADVDFDDYLGHLNGEKIHQKLIPAVVFGKKKKPPTISSSNLSTNETTKYPSSSTRFSSSRFVHVNVQLTQTSKWRWNRGTQFDPHWKKLYSLTMGQVEFTQLPEHSRLHDYFLNFQNPILTTTHQPNSKTGDNLQFLHRRNIRNVDPPPSLLLGGAPATTKSQSTSMIPENIIWIQMETITTYNHNNNNNKISSVQPQNPSSSSSSAEKDYVDEKDLLLVSNNNSRSSNSSSRSNFLSSKNVPDEDHSEFNNDLFYAQLNQDDDGNDDELKEKKKLQENDLDCNNTSTWRKKTDEQEENINNNKNSNNYQQQQVKFFLTCGESCIIEGSNFFGFTNQSLFSVEACSDENEDDGDDDDDSPEDRYQLRKNAGRSTACILHTIASKMKFPVIFSPSASFDQQGITNVLDGSAEIFKRNIDSKFLENYSKGTTLYNSLVFIAKKQFNSVDNTTVLKPFTWAGWLAILLACGAAAINFMKILTMTNSDQSWYDYVVQQVLEIIHEGRASRKKFLRSSVVDSSSGSGGENGEDNNSETDDVPPVSEWRGTTSRALLHGTIRIMSFVMVAIYEGKLYEGKLYNTITFPKNRFVSTFDELLTNDKYALKISREAANVDFLIAAATSSSSSLSSSASPFSGNSKMNRSQILNRFTESFNIEDCINWVEHSVSHGCVAYDFEFRNLPKAHKVRVLNDVNIFAKSKTSILNFSFRHYRPSYAVLHPAAQISRWILEAGIFQFWMVAENFFIENLIPSRMSKRKFFNIKDYLGLFVIYVSLLFLAIFIFASEIIVNWLKRKLEHRSIIDFIIIFYKKVRKLAKSLWQLCVQVKSFFVTRQKCCVKIKRIINNIV